MKKKFSTILTVLVIAMLITSTGGAAGAIKLSGVTFSLGSLITDGFVKGSGQTGITVVLEAKGICTPIEGEPVLVSASGLQFLSGNERSGNERSETKNNKRQFHVETTLQSDVSGCSNGRDIQNVFISWTNASISVFSGEINPCGISVACEGLLGSTTGTDNALLIKQDYNCRTNQDANTVSCKPTKNHDSKDDDDHEHDKK